MPDMIDLYELKNHLFNLYLQDSDIPIIVDLLKNIDFQGIEKLDILFIMFFSPRKIDNGYTDEEIFQKCSDIIDKIADISIYDYSKDELNILKFYYSRLFKKAQSLEEINSDILKLENIIINDNIDNLEPFMIYINEELRIFLLYDYQYDGDSYKENEEKIVSNLNIAKQYKDFRLKISTILGH